MAPALSADGISFSSPGDRNNFDLLVADLSRILGPSSGLTSDDVDLGELTRLMEQYASKEHEWTKYAIEDTRVPYTRNLVDEGNGKSNLLVLVWGPGKHSPIHDHADAHCLMKILKGSLRETRYKTPNADDGAGPVEKIKDTLYNAGEVTYMSDNLGLHRISNGSDTDFAVSLHLYTPPNAARDGCNTFSEATGQRYHCSQNNFTSVRGVRTKPTCLNGAQKSAFAGQCCAR